MNYFLHYKKYFSIPPQTTELVSHAYLPITASSLQRPLSSEPKVTVMERCDLIKK